MSSSPDAAANAVGCTPSVPANELTSQTAVVSLDTSVPPFAAAVDAEGRRAIATDPMMGTKEEPVLLLISGGGEWPRWMASLPRAVNPSLADTFSSALWASSPTLPPLVAAVKEACGRADARLLAPPNGAFVHDLLVMSRLRTRPPLDASWSDLPFTPPPVPPVFTRAALSTPNASIQTSASKWGIKVSSQDAVRCLDTVSPISRLASRLERPPRRRL